MTFKPRKQQIHVPGFGVVQKQDFTQEHFDILMRRAGGDKKSRDEFIKQYFVVDSYDDQPLFEETAAPVKGKKGKVKDPEPKLEIEDETSSAKTEAELEDEDEAELNRLIEEEDKKGKKDNKKGKKGE